MPASDPARQVRFGIKKRPSPSGAFLGSRQVHLMVKRGCHETRALPQCDPFCGHTLLGHSAITLLVKYDTFDAAFQKPRAARHSAITLLVKYDTLKYDEAL